MMSKMRRIKPEILFNPRRLRAFIFVRSKLTQKLRNNHHRAEPKNTIAKKGAANATP